MFQCVVDIGFFCIIEDWGCDWDVCVDGFGVFYQIFIGYVGEGYVIGFVFIVVFYCIVYCCYIVIVVIFVQCFVDFDVKIVVGLIYVDFQNLIDVYV